MLCRDFHFGSSHNSVKHLKLLSRQLQLLLLWPKTMALTLLSWVCTCTFPLSIAACVCCCAKCFKRKISKTSMYFAVIDEKQKEELPEHGTQLSSIRWHLSQGIHTMKIHHSCTDILCDQTDNKPEDRCLDYLKKFPLFFKCCFRIRCANRCEKIENNRWVQGIQVVGTTWGRKQGYCDHCRSCGRPKSGSSSDEHGSHPLQACGRKSAG